jgi:pilus assembly protein Flp/PilA
MRQDWFIASRSTCSPGAIESKAMKAFAHIKAFLKDEEGASGIEYAIIAGMVSLVLITVGGQLSPALQKVYTKIITALQELAK